MIATDAFFNGVREAGEGLLSSLRLNLLEVGAMCDSAGVIPDDFGGNSGLVYAALMEAWRAGEPYDFIRLMSRLRGVQSTSMFRSADAIAIVSNFFGCTATSGLADRYIQTLLEARAARKLHELGSRLQARAFDASTDIVALLEDAQKELSGIGARPDTTHKHISHFAREIVADLEEPEKHKNAEVIEIGLGIDEMAGPFERGDLLVVAGLTKGGKALDCNTPIAVPTGWSTMGDIKVGDLVFDESGLPTRVTAATERMIGRSCFRVVFSDGSEIVADEEHLWKTMTASERSSASTRTDEWRASRRARRECSGKRKPSHVGLNTKPQPTGALRTSGEIARTLVSASRNGRKNHSIENCLPLNCQREILPLDPYVLGAWLGDGSSSGGVIHGLDEGVFSEIAKAGFRVTYRSVKSARGVLGLKAILRRMDLLNNKRIPSKYLRAHAEQRLALLQGLMDTDGYSEPGKGRCEFTTTSVALRDGMCELLATLGIKFTCGEGRATLYGRDISAKWRIQFSTELPAFRLHRKLERQRKTQAHGISRKINRRTIVACEKIESVPVRCIQVESQSGMFLAGRTMIPTHNSSLAGNMIEHCAQQGRRCAMFSFEMTGKQNVQRMLASHTRINIRELRNSLVSDKTLFDDNQAHAMERYRLDRIRQTAQEMEGWKVEIFERLKGIEQVTAEMARMKALGGLDVAMIDYAQLVRGLRSKGESREREVASISYELKQACMRNECLGILLSQLTVDSNGGAHLRESRALGQDANCVLFIEGDGREKQLRVVAARSAPSGSTIDLVWEEEFTKFSAP